MFIALGRTYVLDPLNWADMLSVGALPLRIAAGFVSWAQIKKQQKYGEKNRLVEKNQDLGDLGKVLNSILDVGNQWKPMLCSPGMTWGWCCRSHKNNLMTWGW
jgi:hypothetical protein